MAFRCRVVGCTPQTAHSSSHHRLCDGQCDLAALEQNLLASREKVPLTWLSTQQHSRRPRHPRTRLSARKWILWSYQNHLFWEEYPRNHAEKKACWLLIFVNTRPDAHSSWHTNSECRFLQSSHWLWRWWCTSHSRERRDFVRARKIGQSIGHFCIIGPHCAVSV
jgi:hypothetical protein